MENLYSILNIFENSNKQHLDRINKESTQRYIDSHLGEGKMLGEDFAKILHDQGYKGSPFSIVGSEKDYLLNFRPARNKCDG